MTKQNIKGGDEIRRFSDEREMVVSSVFLMKISPGLFLWDIRSVSFRSTSQQTGEEEETTTIITTKTIIIIT